MAEDWTEDLSKTANCYHTSHQLMRINILSRCQEKQLDSRFKMLRKVRRRTWLLEFYSSRLLAAHSQGVCRAVCL
jgi:hypothetical protein